MARDFRRGDKRLTPLSLFSQSSLTDIVLLLLIFFLLTSSFVTNFGIKRIRTGNSVYFSCDH